MELWDLYNEKREVTGRLHVRGEEGPEGYFHLVVDVWIRNSKGEYLISQRAASRPSFPLMWECVGGSVIAGEDSLTGALRETKEEVGVDLALEDGYVVYSNMRRHFRDMMDVWLFRYDGPVELEKATTDEVAQVRWMTVEQIRVLWESGELVPTLGYFFEEVAGERCSTKSMI